VNLHAAVARDLAATVALTREVAYDDNTGRCCDPREEPAWIHRLNKAEVDIMAGHCYTGLSRPLRGEPLLREAIDGYDPSHVREVSPYLTWLAEDYIQAREIDQACATATRALSLASGNGSARNSGRISVVRSKLGPFRRLRAVRDFDDLCRERAQVAPQA
jgi:hypothetical protein